MQISPSGYLKGNVMRIADKFPGIPNDLDAVVTWTLTRRTKARTYFFKVILNDKNVFVTKSFLYMI